MTDAPDRDTSRRRKIRGRNIALLIALVSFIILVYFITIVQLKRGTAVQLAPDGESPPAASAPATGAAPTGGGAAQ